MFNPLFSQTSEIFLSNLLLGNDSFLYLTIRKYRIFHLFHLLYFRILKCLPMLSAMTSYLVMSLFSEVFFLISESFNIFFKLFLLYSDLRTQQNIPLSNQQNHKKTFTLILIIYILINQTNCVW